MAPIICKATPELPEDWNLPLETELSYHIDFDNRGVTTILDQMSDQYQFANAEPDFFGDPELHFKLTTVDTSCNLSDFVSSFLDLTAPFEMEQYLDEEWMLQTTYILPLFVPVNHWTDLEDEFAAQTDQVSFEDSFTGEYIYEVTWIANVTQYKFEFVWQDTDGSLQAVNYEILKNGQYDRVHLALSGITKPNKSSSISNMVLYYGIPMFILGVVGIYVKYKVRKAKQAKLNANVNEINELNKSHTNGLNSVTEAELFENQAEIRENYRHFRTRYLIRTAVFNGLAIPLFITGLKLLKGVGTSAADEWKIMVIIMSCVFFAGDLVFGVSLPLFKIIRRIKKRLKTHDYRNSQRPILKQDLDRHFIDISPILTFVWSLTILISSDLIFTIRTMPSLGGKILMATLLIVEIGVICASYFMFPFRMLVWFRKYAMKHNYTFNSNPEMAFSD